MPSVFEGFGLAAAEAMAAGRPVVASAVDGLQEVVADGVTGRLVAGGNVAAWAARIVDLIADGAARARLGRNGRRRVERHFSLDRFNRSHLQLYRLLGRGRRGAPACRAA